MLSRLSRPFRPIDLDDEPLAFFQLARLGEDLVLQAEYADSGIGSIDIARDERVTLVLVALRSGAQMREHRTPSDGTLVVLSGRVRFLSDERDVREELSAGAMAVFAPQLCHAVEAIEDSAFLLIIGGRERPEASRSHGEPLSVPGS